MSFVHANLNLSKMKDTDSLNMNDPYITTGHLALKRHVLFHCLHHTRKRHQVSHFKSLAFLSFVANEIV